MSGQSALILGATGQVGGFLLKELLASSHFTRVGEFGRRNTSLEGLAAGKDKLEQRTIDFEKPDAAGLRDDKWDVIFIALGTSAKAAGSPEAFERIDREYVINAARAAKSESHPQRLVYVSSLGADPKSRFLYARSKGLTEEGLAGLGYQETIVFRPGALAGTNRSEFRLAERVAL
jgi:oxidoreductase